VTKSSKPKSTKKRKNDVANLRVEEREKGSRRKSSSGEKQGITEMSRYGRRGSERREKSTRFLGTFVLLLIKVVY